MSERPAIFELATFISLPPSLSFDEWYRVGCDLAKSERRINWIIGDWWAYDRHRYGGRLKTVNSEDWRGPAFRTCSNNAAVCRAFGSSRRRECLSFSHHAEVAGLESKAADQLLDSAEKHHWSVRDLRGKVFKHRRDLSRVERMNEGCTVADLERLVSGGKKFSTIYCDPPWCINPDRDDSGWRCSADRHFETMPLGELKTLPIPPLAGTDCSLLLLSTMTMLPAALNLIASWRFSYRTVAFNWIKQNPSGEGLFFSGMGRWTRGNSELCLLASKGSPDRLANDVSHVILSPVTRHSAKPLEAYERIERLLSGPFLELFARESRLGWTCWGNEIKRTECSEAAE